jgi:hypothetical protein
MNPVLFAKLRYGGQAMGNKFWRGISALAAVVAGVGSARTADLAVQAPVYKAPPVFITDWATTATTSVTVEQSVDVAKGGLSYKF